MGRPARIDRDAVLGAALAIADAEGLDALTMGAVARRLEVTPMALYRHVASKADLLDGLVERLLDELQVQPQTSGVDWSERLAAAARATRVSARRHPAVFPLLLQRPATTVNARRVRDAIEGAVREAGVAPGLVSQTERLVSTAILGFAVSEVAGRFARHSRRQLDADFERLLAWLGQLIESQHAH